MNILEILKSRETWEKEKEKLKTEILANYSKRSEPVDVFIGEEKINMNKANLLTSLIVLRGYVERDYPISKEDLVYSGININKDYFVNYFNNIIERFSFDIDRVRIDISESMSELTNLAGELAKYAGNTISLYDFVKLNATNPEANKIFNHKLSENLSFADAENEFNVPSYTTAFNQVF